MVTPPGDDDVVEILGADRPMISDHWHGLPRRTRLTLTAATCTILLGGLLAYVSTHRPPPPPPDPVAATSISITDVEVPVGYSPDFGITLSASASTRVAFGRTAEGYGNLVLHVTPGAGAVLGPGHTRVLYARAVVCTCHVRHPARGTPLLFVTLRNARGEGRVQVVPTAVQFDLIDRAVRHACGGTV
jgi:hypothetical protein